jgi:hypothetical protein
VTSSVNPSVFGQAVTFTATVAAIPPATGTPTGTVTFLSGFTTLGTAVLTESSIDKDILSRHRDSGFFDEGM